MDARHHEHDLESEEQHQRDTETDAAELPDNLVEGIHREAWINYAITPLARE